MENLVWPKKRSQPANQESTQKINVKEEGVFHKPENEDENSLSNLSWKKFLFSFSFKNSL